jgi:hypothetical protein
MSLAGFDKQIKRVPEISRCRDQTCPPPVSFCSVMPRTGTWDAPQPLSFLARNNRELLKNQAGSHTGPSSLIFF